MCELSLRYPNGKLALSDFNLSVAAGEFVVVLGGNGSGKTTLLRSITRTVEPSAGEVWLDGVDLCTLEGEKLRRARLALAMVWQHASLVKRERAGQCRDWNARSALYAAYRVWRSAGVRA